MSNAPKPGFVEMVRRANAPVAPENSLTFRLATAGAVITGVLSCAAVNEISLASSVLACAGTVLGMLFSYFTRSRPWQWVKILLALAVLGIFASFVLQVLGAARVGQLSSIEVPLAGLFIWVQLIHSFDVPGRRDLLFSLAASGALITLGAAQAVSILPNTSDSMPAAASALRNSVDSRSWSSMRAMRFIST